MATFTVIEHESTFGGFDVSCGDQVNAAESAPAVVNVALAVAIAIYFAAGSLGFGGSGAGASGHFSTKPSHLADMHEPSARQCADRG